GIGVDGYGIAFAHDCNGAAIIGLRGYVSDHEPMRGAAEAPVGHKSDAIGKTGAHDRTGHLQHFAHSRPAARAFVPDDDDVAGLHLAFFDSLLSLFFALEDARGTVMHRLVM